VNLKQLIIIYRLQRKNRGFEEDAGQGG